MLAPALNTIMQIHTASHCPDDSELVDWIKTLVDERHCALECLDRCRYVVEAAGIDNLAQGVKLGAVSWSVKMHDAIKWAKRILEGADETGTRTRKP